MLLPLFLLESVVSMGWFTDVVGQGGVANRLTSRSKYGTKKPKAD